MIRGRVPLAGRDRELREIEQARSERHAGVLIIGESGVGKTTLARAFASAAKADGARILSIAATEGSSVPFGAFAPLLPLAVHDPDPFVMLRRATEWFPRAVKRVRPPALIVDDAQWLDPPSAMLVHQLVRTRRVFLVATARRGTRLIGALADTGMDADIARIDLHPLDRTRTFELAALYVGGAVEHRTAQWLWEASGGNALFLRELIAAARADKTLILDRGIWRLITTPHLSPSLRDLLATQMSNLASPARWTLALVGEGGPIPLSELLTQTTEDVLLDLEERALVAAETGTKKEFVRIAHPMYGVAIRSSLPPLLTRRVARTLAAMLMRRTVLGSGDALRLVRWMIACGQTPARELLVRASNEANSVGAPKEAAEFAQRALAETPTVEALLEFARAQISLRRFDSAIDALTRVEPLLESPAQGLIYLEQQCDLWYWSMRDSTRARELLARAVTWWDSDEWLSDVEALQVRLLAFEPGRSSPVPNLVDTPQAATTEAAPVRVANLLRLGRVLEAHAQSELHRGLEGPPTTATIIARAARARAVLDSGIDWPGYEREMLALMDRGIQTDDFVAAGQSAFALAMLARAAGRYRSARNLAVEAEIRLERYDPFGIVPLVICMQVECDCFIGDHERATENLARVETLVQEPLLAHQAPMLMRARAWVAHSSGDHERAQRLLIDAATMVDGPMYAAGLYHEAFRAGAPAVGLVELLEGQRRLTDSPLTDLFSTQVAAVAARDAGALVAVSVEFERIGASRDAAEASAQAASAFALQGRVDSARRAAARSRSLIPTDEDASVPTIAELDGVAVSLTRRERQIAALATRGLSNAVIAERLSVSVRTVESHLYRAMQKVGATDRHDFDL